MSTVNRKIRFGIAFQSNKTPAQYEGLAELVDRYDFDVVSVYNDLFFQPALGALILMARHLKRAQVGPAALNPYTLHPVEIAGQAALLDLVSEGRAYLGLVRGSWLDRLGIEATHPLQTLREAALLCQHLWAGDSQAFEGQVFKLAAGSSLNYEPLRPEIPIMIGTWGQQTARMAGELASEVKIGGSANPAMITFLRPAIDAGSLAVGKAARSVGICAGAVTVVSHDRTAARNLVRREVALYLPVVTRLDPTLQDPEWLKVIQQAAVRGDYDLISRQISDELLDKFAFAGSPADIIRQVENLMTAGVDRLEFGTPHGLDSAEGIRLLGTEVLPYFKK